MADGSVFSAAVFNSISYYTTSCLVFLQKQSRTIAIFITVFALLFSILATILFLEYNHSFQIETTSLITLFFILGCIQFFRPLFSLKLQKNLRFILSLFLAIGLRDFFLYGILLPRSYLASFLVNLLLALCFAYFIHNILFKEKSNGWFFLFWFSLFFFSINSGYSHKQKTMEMLFNSVFYLGGILRMIFSFILTALFWITQRFKKIRWVFAPVFLLYLATSYVDLNYFISSRHRLSGYLVEMGATTGHAINMASAYLNFRFFGSFVLLALFVSWRILLYRQKK